MHIYLVLKKEMFIMIKPCRSAGNVKKNLFKNNILMSNKMLMLFNFLGETLDSLGIGIIDIKGGKVVKIGKSKYYAYVIMLLNNIQIHQVVLVSSFKE